MVFAFLWRVIKWTIIIAIFVLLINFWLSNKSYVFTENDVASIAKKYTGSNVEASYKKVYADLKQRYPGHVLAESDLQWIFVNAGGWMGSMCLVHASLTEYVLFFGTPIDTAGHSGRYWANISDTVMTGTFKQWQEGSLQANVYKTGDTIHHAWGEATAVHFAGGTWMVEYGRGFIPSTMTFALADTLFSTTDFVTLFYTIRVYSKALFQEYCGYFIQMGDYITEHL